jgi:hypothetical protein
MQTLQPTPTCAHFRTTDLPCLKCSGEMTLMLIEPGGPNFEKLTYRCEPCDLAETFLMAIKSDGNFANIRYPRTDDDAI